MSLKQTLKGTSYILSQQLLTRTITFSSNVYITRICQFGLLGSLQDFDLFHSSILFLCRETIRITLLRNSKTGRKQSENIQFQLNMSFIPIFLYLCLIPFILYFCNNLNNYKTSNLDQQSINLNYKTSLIYQIYFIAAGIELLSEPMYIYCQSLFLYEIRVVLQDINLECRRNCFHTTMFIHIIMLLLWSD